MATLIEGQSKAEKVFVQDGIEQNIRGDGRRREDFRNIQLALGIIDTANGSALLSLGGTEVLAVVKAEIGRPSELAPRCGRIACSVELPAGDDRAVTEEMASDLASALERAIAGPRPAAAALDLGTLCIQPGQRCWVLYIDALVLNADGNELDALSIAAKAALADVKIPKVTVVPGASADEPGADPRGARGVETAPVGKTAVGSNLRLLNTDLSTDHTRPSRGDANPAPSTPLPSFSSPPPTRAAELELDDDPGAAVRLDVTQVPTLCGKHYIVDATAVEQTHVDAAVTLAVTEQGAIRGAANKGSVGLPAAAATEMMALAKRTGITLQRELQTFLIGAESAAAEPQE